MRALARVDKPNDADQLQPLLGSDYVSATFRNQLGTIVTATMRYLEPFPYALDYLHNMWSDFDYWGSPKQRWANEPLRRSYPAWAEAMEKSEREAMLVGLDEEGPVGLSTPDDVTAALPPKQPINRMFRLFRSGATG